MWWLVRLAVMVLAVWLAVAWTSGTSAELDQFLDVSAPKEAVPEENRRLATELAKAATVRISTTICSHAVAGSGFMVEDRLLTNRHVVEGSGFESRRGFDSHSGFESDSVDGITQIRASRPGLRELTAIDGLAKSLDVATLNPVSTLPLTLADANPSEGSTVWFAGRPRGKTDVVEAHVKGFSPGYVWGLPGSVMVLDGESMLGYSGGPVLNTEGQVVGMLQALEATTGLTLAIPVEDLAQQLESEPGQWAKNPELQSGNRCDSGK